MKSNVEWKPCMGKYSDEDEECLVCPAKYFCMKVMEQRKDPTYQKALKRFNRDEANKKEFDQIVDGSTEDQSQ
jgi:hypothetical protein